MAIYTEKQRGNVSVMMILLELQSTVAARSHFCVFILKTKNKSVYSLGTLHQIILD